MFLLNLTYDNRSSLILCFGWDFQTIRIVPERLHLDKVDPMFLLVCCAFKWVKLEIRNGIINIPLRQILSMGDLPIRTIEYAGQDSTSTARPGGSQWTR